MGEGGEPWTVLRLLNWTKDYFAGKGVDAPRLAAEVLLAHVLGCPRIELYARFNQEPDEAKRTAFRQLVKRAAEHEPVAYLVGAKEFYSLRFAVRPGVLVPRPETEILVAETLDHLQRCGASDGPPRVWDVCTGSGCVAVAVAHECGQSLVLATDTAPAALEVAEDNAEAHGVASRVRVREADLLALPADCADMPPFDVIVSNPPYVAEGDEVGPETAHEPPEALYAAAGGLAALEAIIRGAPPLLAPGGVLIVEFGRGQADAVHERLEATGAFEPARFLRDHQNIDRAAVAVKA